ncbi:MAG TPA: hypothetical protein VFC53_06475 [Dehalococcoidia bacterium]|nr:hypothetical protein [Dehalococcoidia bacterium]
MLGRWFFLAVVGIGLIVIVNARKSDAAPARITQSCAEPAGPVAVTLAWRASRTPAAETWVDVALAPGFAPGTYAGHGPLPGDAIAYTLDAVPPGLALHYRVQARRGETWRVLAAGNLTAACPDAAPEQTAIAAH